MYIFKGFYLFPFWKVKLFKGLIRKNSQFFIIQGIGHHFLIILGWCHWCYNLYLLTLFKSLKSSKWKWHTVIASISVCIHSRGSKFVIIDKICRHPFSSNVPEVKCKGKISNLSILCSNSRLICYFFPWILTDFSNIDCFGTRSV